MEREARNGRLLAQPNVFYIGVNNGGVWKTDTDGRTWKPIVNET